MSIYHLCLAIYSFHGDPPYSPQVAVVLLFVLPCCVKRSESLMLSTWSWKWFTLAFGHFSAPTLRLGVVRLPMVALETHIQCLRKESPEPISHPMPTQPPLSNQLSPCIICIIVYPSAFSIYSFSSLHRRGDRFGSVDLSPTEFFTRQMRAASS